MKLFFIFARIYPLQSALTLGSLLLASLIEGIGLTTLLPVLAAQSPEMAVRLPSGLSRAVEQALDYVGLAPTIGVLLLIVVIGVTLKCILVLAANRQVGVTVGLVATDLRLAFIRSLLSAQWEYYLRQPVGALANSVSTEAGRASAAYLHGVRNVALAAQVAVYSGIAMVVSLEATLAALTVGTGCVYLLNRLVLASRRAGKKQTRLMRALLVRLSDNMQSIKPLKAMAREDLAGVLLESDTTRLNRAVQKDIASTEALRALQEPMFAILIATGLYVALDRFGMSLASVMLLAFLLLRVLSYLGRIQREYQRLVAAESGYWALQSAIDSAKRAGESPLTGVTPILQRAIRFENVGFKYKDQWVLRNIALTVPAGEITAIVGASGAGKTTVVDLVTALLQPQEGEIWIDDIPLPQVDRRSWRRMIGYVPQDTVLLHDTVAKNVTLGDPALTDADAEAAVRAAGIWDFVSGLPEGMGTIVGERGGNLSGGQRQRVAIARALAHKPRLLILDEATNALDAESEAAICRTLESLRGELTIVAISHQSPLVEVADRVYRMGDGSATLVADRRPLIPA